MVTPTGRQVAAPPTREAAVRLRLILYPAETPDDGRRQPLATCELAGPEASLGSATACALGVASWPPLAATLRALPDGTWELHPHDAPWQRGDTPIAAPHLLRNGDRLRLGQHEVLAAYQFANADRRLATQWLPRLATALIVAVLLAQLAMMVWLPWRAARLETGGAELMRQQTIRLLDTQRQRTEALRHQLAGQPRPLAALTLIRQELDSIADFLRQHGDHARGADLRRLHDDLLSWREQLTLLEEERLLPPDAALDPAAPLSRWLAP